MKDLEVPDLHLTWHKISLSSKVVFICCLYRPQASPTIDYLNQINIGLESILTSHPAAEIIVLGDFNIHNSDWLAHSFGTDQGGRDTEMFVVMNNLTQQLLVSEPTCIPDRLGDAANTLDLFLTTHPNNYKVNVSSPLGSPNHSVILAQSEIVDNRTRTKPQPHTIWQFQNADWDRLRSFYSGAQ